MNAAPPITVKNYPLVLKDFDSIRSTDFYTINGFLYDGADERSRTSDLRITNALLYQLSYIGEAQILAETGILFSASATSPTRDGDQEQTSETTHCTYA